MQEEVNLFGGTHGPVIRIGDTVRREPRPSTSTVQCLLRHLERAGFDGAPRALGYDEQGREILGFIPGEVVGQGDGGPPPAYLRAESTLVDLARLLHRYHDATAGFVPPPDAIWSFQTGAPRAGEVICHNDIGPWNTVFRNGRPHAFIDFDTAAPGSREWDVAYALYRFIPFIPDEVCIRFAGWSAPPDRPARLRLFCEAYGLEASSDIGAVIARRIEVMIATGMTLNAAGDPRYGQQWRQVMKPRLLRDLDFVVRSSGVGEAAYGWTPRR
ncbi:MAG: phosphotransferase [Dehalococcoidia bacterium]